MAFTSSCRLVLTTATVKSHNLEQIGHREKKYKQMVAVHIRDVSRTKSFDFFTRSDM
jgi:hypothetical protein